MAITRVTSGVITDGTIANADLADDAVGVAELSATGTASATTFLRGDNAWAAAGGDNTPAFMVNRITSAQAIPYDTQTKIQFNGEVYDPDNVFDSTTNYRFTVPSGEGGNYFLFWTIFLEALSNTTLLSPQITCRVNGTTEWYHSDYYNANPIRWVTKSGQAMLALSAADYVEIWVLLVTSNSAAGQTGYSNSYINTGFGGFKLL